MAEQFYGENGFEKCTIDAWNAIKAAQDEYAQSNENLRKIVGKTEEDIKNGYDEDAEAAKNLIKVNNELIDVYGEELDAVRKVYQAFKDLKDARQAEWELSKRIAQEAEEKRIAEEKAAAEAARQQEIKENSAKGASDVTNIATKDQGGNIASDSDAQIEQPTTNKLSHNEMVDLVYGMGVGTYRNGSQRVQLVEAQYPGTYNIAQNLLNEAIAQDRYNYDHNGTKWKQTISRLASAAGYDTGGYTGT